MRTSLLAIEGLTVTIGGVAVVDGVSLEVASGRVLALVGESGCGKSLTALSILRLLPPAARFESGRVRLADQELTALSDGALNCIRGNRVSIIFQEPVASLNPLMPVGVQVAEALSLHRGLSAATARKQAIAILARVGIPDAARRAGQYPFELSGGMRQRVMIAAALICRPQLLIADEPTTALDVTIQAQVLDLIKRLRDEAGTTILLITHDMGVVAEMADEVAVMYGGRIVESGGVGTIFAAPAHPYTRLLLATVPRLDDVRKTALRTIEGTVPSAGAWPEGCRFRNRCPLADAGCSEVPPLAQALADEGGSAPPRGMRRGDESHRTACWHSDRVAELA